jgi:hypothetical protein
MLVFALVVVPMAAYVGGYYGLQCATHEVGGLGRGRMLARVYEHRWQADAFKPAARVESWVTGSDVTVSTRTYRLGTPDRD